MVAEVGDSGQINHRKKDIHDVTHVVVSFLVMQLI